MYAKSLHIYDFRCFGKAEMTLQYPGRLEKPRARLNNVNLILGDNGGGKSSALRAIAISILAPTLLESGFVSHHLVRRPGSPDTESLLKVKGVLSEGDLLAKEFHGTHTSKEIELLARVQQRPKSSMDRLHLDHTPNSPLETLIYDDESPAFFVVGYGATRRVEAGDFSPSSARKTRGLRYQRVASLFEDHVALQPFSAWFNHLGKGARRKEVLSLLNRILPRQIAFDGEWDKREDQYLFRFEGNPLPFSTLSDGFRAYIGWVGDLIANLCDVCPRGYQLTDVPGIVLVDEIDLHLHPAWQRRVVTDIAHTFPKLQFVFTSHSALIVNSVEPENIFITERERRSGITITQLAEDSYGRGVDKLLTSSYFGLDSLRPSESIAHGKQLLAEAMRGDTNAALRFLDNLVNSSTDEAIPGPRKKIAAKATAITTRKGAAKKKAAKKPSQKKKAAVKKKKPASKNKPMAKKNPATKKTITTKKRPATKKKAARKKR